MQIADSEKRLFDSLRDEPSEDDILRVIDTVRTKYPTDAEVAAHLARILAESGKFINTSAKIVADVASTGGPSSLSTIISPLYLRAAGAVVPKLGVQGRPAGGVDCLAQIPGYRIILSLEEIERILESSGYAHFLVSDEMAPMDRRMFRIRQELQALAVPGLVAASLLSKKIAVGIQYAGLDIRVSEYGNFGTDWGSAKENAKLFIEAAKILGITASPVLTDARQPYQPYIGRSESLVAIDEFLDGNASTWLQRHCLQCRTLVLACIPEEFRKKVSDTNYEELKAHFKINLEEQGSCMDNFQSVVQRTRGGHQNMITSEHSGFCQYDLKRIRDTIVKWQKNCATKENHFSDPVGLVFLREPGIWVSEGESLATLRAPKHIAGDVLNELQPWISRPAHAPKMTGMEAVHG